MGEGWEAPRRVPRWPLVLLFGALLLGGALAAGLRLADRGPTEPEGLRVSDVPAAPPPLMAPAERVLGGTASALPDAPLAPRRLAATAGMGRTLLVWGGVRDDAPLGLLTTDPGAAPLLDDGAVLDVATGAWTALPAWPLVPRAGASAVAMPERGEILVLGGSGPAGPEVDGAIWSAADDAWRAVAPAPLRRRAGLRAVWTGSEVVVLGGATASGPDDGAASGAPTDVAVLDPTAGWRSGAPLPATLGTVTGAAWDGDDVAVWDGSLLALYRPEEDAWRTLVPRPVEASGRGGEIVRAQHVMVAADALPQAGGREAWGLTWQGASWGAVRTGPVAPQLRHEVLWTGAAVLAVPRAERSQDAPPPAAYFPFGNAWAALPEDATTGRPGQALAWLDDALVSWGGEAGGRTAVDGVLWRPASGPAAELAPP